MQIKIIIEPLTLRKSVRIRSYSVPYSPAFGMNTERNSERYSVSLLFSPNVGKCVPEQLCVGTHFTQCIVIT